MDDRRKDQAERIVKRYAHLIEMQTGKAVRPYRADGYVNMMNKYGTSKDTTEGYRFRAEPVVPDELLTMYYEGNGLFAKIIDRPQRRPSSTASRWRAPKTRKSRTSIRRPSTSWTGKKRP